MAEIDSSILHWEEQGWIASAGGIVDACAGQVMEQDDGKVLEIKPHGVKEAAPIVHHAVKDCAAVQLGAHCLKNEACINRESFEHALGYVVRYPVSCHYPRGVMCDSTSQDTALTTRDMQLELHLKGRCNWNCTNKKHAIGIAPTREMRLELNLQELLDNQYTTIIHG
jgi:hypothetical protein